MAADLPPPSVDTVIVQPARLPPSVGEAAFSVIKVDPATLAARPRLDEVLTDVPGVSLFRRTSSLGANPTTQGISLRGIAGSGASRALVTLDGVPQNDPFGGWVIWTGVPSLTIENASVVRGAGAGAYGAGALTGAIALDEAAAIPGWVAGEAAVGSLDYRRGSGVIDAPVGSKTRVMVMASGEHSDGWIPVEKARRGAADKKLSLSDWSGAFRVLTEVGPGSLAFRVSTFEEKRSAGLVGADSRVTGNAASLTYAVAPAGDKLGYRVQAWARTSNLQNSSAAVAAGRNTTTPASNQYDTPARGYGFNAAVRRTASNYTWEIGADVREAEGETREYFRYMAPAFTRTRVAGGKTLVGGLYAEGSRTAGPWLLTGNIRLDGWRSYDARRIERDAMTGAVTLDAPPADRDGAVPTARVGAKYGFDNDLFFRAAAYAGFRPATLNELHRPFRVGNDVTEANAGLKPERLYGVEAGVGSDNATFNWDVGVFYNRLNDAIANVTIGVGPGTFPIAGLIPAGGVLRQRQNAGSVDAYGVEADATYRLGSRFSLNLGAGYTHAEVDGGSAAPQLTGLRPAQTPRFTALAGATWKPIEPVTIRADVHYEGFRFDDDQNVRRLKAGTTVDLRADVKVAGAVSVFASAENLFDQNIVTAVTGDGVRSFGPPQVFRAGLTIRR
jgi:outer membrane receptor protein involved in Fe transport